MNFVNKINEVFDLIGNWFLNNQKYSKILIFSMLIIGLLLIIIPTFVKGTRQIYKKVEQAKRDFITHEKKRYIQDYIDISITRWMDDTFKYSRIFNTKFGNLVKTSASFFLFAIFVAAAIMAIVVILTRNILLAVMSFGFGIALLYTVLFLIRLVNKSSVTNDLINFLNLLGNYSTANTEIFSTFSQIANQVNEPLATCLNECVAESQDPNKSKISALRNLANKIEDEKFKEIIKNLEIAQNNSGSFSQIVATNRHSLLEYIHGKKLRAGIARENLISFGVIFMAIIGILFFMGQILTLNVFHLLVTTTSGIVVLSIAVAITLGFILSAIASSK